MCNNDIINLRRLYQNKLSDEKTTSDSIIYHYTSPDALLSILNNNILWFSDINYLNDETEMKYTYELLSQRDESLMFVLDKRFSRHLSCLLDKTIYEKRDILWKNLHKETYYVASFSTKLDNLALWNYYTKTSNMAGYNIGFDKKNIINKVENKIKNQASFVHGKVIYSLAKQKELIDEALKDFSILYVMLLNKNVEDFVIDNLFDSFLGLIRIFSLFFKQNCFESDYEYRLVIKEFCDPMLKHENAYNCLYRQKNGFFIPYIEQNFEKIDVKKITISPTIKQEHYKASAERLLLQSNYINTEVENSRIPLRY